jgi:type III pantothenate kinase
MLLALDVGNTNVKVGVFEGSKLIGPWQLSTVHNRTGREWSALIRGVSPYMPKLDSLEGIVIVSVVPILQPAFATMGAQYFGATTLFVTPNTDTGLKMRYDNPSELGADRLVNSTAAFNRYGGPTLVVDVGTAINFDVVSENGEFLGGMICPGIEMCLRGLHAMTARLPLVELRRPASVIGTGTVHCIRSGIYYGLAGMIDGIAERVSAELGDEVTVIGTGGQSREISAASRVMKEINENLTLQGLEYIWRRNQTRGIVNFGTKTEKLMP